MFSSNVHINLQCEVLPSNTFWLYEFLCVLLMLFGTVSMWKLCCRSNININDVLGDYSLTLVDVLDTLAVRAQLSPIICLL